MFIHDIIKINLSRDGYLPNYPPHLLSDEEMCDAFLPYEYDESDPCKGFDDFMKVEVCYFKDYYPLVHKDLLPEYKELVSNIAYHLYKLKESHDDEYSLPDWVYSFMLGQVLGVQSDKNDLHDMFVMLGTDNIDDEFEYDCCRACYHESKRWLMKIPEGNRDHRPPTLFGEMHVLKSLRLRAASMQEDEIGEYIQNEIASGRPVI